MKSLYLILLFLVLAGAGSSQGLTYGPADKFRKPSTPDSLYKEAETHLIAGSSLCVLGPVALATGGTLLAIGTQGKVQLTETSGKLVFAFGGVLTVLGAVACVVGPIAITRGTKEIRPARQRRLPGATVNLPLPVVNYPLVGASGFSLGLGTSIRF